MFCRYPLIDWSRLAGVFNRNGGLMPDLYNLLKGQCHEKNLDRQGFCVIDQFNILFCQIFLVQWDSSFALLTLGLLLAYMQAFRTEGLPVLIKRVKRFSFCRARNCLPMFKLIYVSYSFCGTVPLKCLLTLFYYVSKLN